MTCLLYWLTGFRGEDFKTFFPIGSYVKTMSAEGGHLGFPTGIKNRKFVEDLPMIIPRQFGFNYPSGFREEAF